MAFRITLQAFVLSPDIHLAADGFASSVEAAVWPRLQEVGSAAGCSRSRATPGQWVI